MTETPLMTRCILYMGARISHECIRHRLGIVYDNCIMLKCVSLVVKLSYCLDPWVMLVEYVYNRVCSNAPCWKCGLPGQSYSIQDVK